MDERQYDQLKSDIRRKILESLPVDFFEVNDDITVEKKITELCLKFLPWNLKRESERLVEELVHDFLGFGPIQPLMADPLVTDIMINGPYVVFVERAGKIEKTNVKFRNEDQLNYYIEKMLTSVGKSVSELEPYVDAQLKDGSRINVVIPPISGNWPLVTIRKFWDKVWSLQDLERMEVMTAEVREFLDKLVKRRKNIIVTGGAGAGKTTLLNALARAIPYDERTVVIEEVAEVRMYQANAVFLRTRLGNVEGRGEVTLRNLVRNALRMRPDRLIIGEIMGEEVLDVLQAMNTGHNGSMCTLHANSTAEAISRLEVLSFLSGIANISVEVIRRIIGAAVDVLIFMQRDEDGNRRIDHISEVIWSDDKIKVENIFERNREGELVATGYCPTFGFE